MRLNLLLALLLCSTSAAFTQVKSFKMSVYFDNDQATLRRDARQTLDQLADSVQGLDLRKIITKGNTDSNADSLYNMQLSDKRTEAVTAYLVRKGLAAKLFTKEHYGEEKPVATNETDAGKQQNRRVDIIVFYSKPAPPPVVVSRDSVKPPQPVVKAQPAATPRPCSQDTTFTLPNGTQLTMNLCDYRERWDCLDVAEVLDAASAMEQGVSTIDNAGFSLTSCGMLLMTPKATPGCSNDCFKYNVTVRLPAPSQNECAACKSRSMLYDIDENGRWTASKSKMKEVTVNGKPYYEYTMRCPGKKNCDCPIPDKKIRVKVPRRYRFTSLTLSSDCPFGVYTFEAHKRRQHVIRRRRVPCFIGAGNITATVVDRKTGDTLRVTTQPLSNTKERRICVRCKGEEIRRVLWVFPIHKKLLYRKYKVKQELLTREQEAASSEQGNGE